MYCLSAMRIHHSQQTIKTLQLPTMSLLHQQDAVAVVARKLKLEKPISEKVIKQTQSALRTLKINNPIRSFGKQDNDLKRACALLEYIVREQEGFKIPMSKLAKAAYMKQKDFEEFHHKIGNFRENTASKSSISSKITGSDAEDKQKSSIPLLSIKLGPLVQESNQVAVRAQKRFDNILNYAKKMLRTESRYQVRDMKRYLKTYEAACFFFEATRDKAVNDRSLQNNDDEDEKRLELSTFLDVSTEFTAMEFKNVLGHVQTLSDEMENTREKHDTGEAPSKNRVSGTKKRESQNVTNTSSVKRIKQGKMLSAELASNTTLDLLKKVNDEQELGNDQSETWNTSGSPHSGDSSLFLEWKRKLVGKAIKCAKENLNRESTVGDQIISNEMALTRAVADVLSSHGLLQVNEF